MLFDTTFLIDFEREVKRSRPGRAHAFLSANPTIPLAISIISVGEFVEGFDAGQEQDCWLCLRHYTVLNFEPRNCVASRAAITAIAERRPNHRRQ